MQSSTHRILKDRKFLIISAHASKEAAIFIIEEGKHTLQYPGGLFTLTEQSAVSVHADEGPHTAMIDVREIEYPMLLRKWKTGDYFYPLGMKKKKKLSRFFIDNKLSVLQKEQVWVLESNKRIVWLVGLRIDDRFKILPSTTTALKLRLSPFAR